MKSSMSKAHKAAGGSKLNSITVHGITYKGLQLLKADPKPPPPFQHGRVVLQLMTHLLCSSAVGDTAFVKGVDSKLPFVRFQFLPCLVSVAPACTGSGRRPRAFSALPCL